MCVREFSFFSVSLSFEWIFLFRCNRCIWFLSMLLPSHKDANHFGSFIKNSCISLPLIFFWGSVFSLLLWHTPVLHWSVYSTGFRSFCTHFTNSLRFTACSTRCRPLLWLIFYSQYILSPPRANMLVCIWKREREVQTSQSDITIGYSNKFWVHFSMQHSI